MEMSGKGSKGFIQSVGHPFGTNLHFEVRREAQRHAAFIRTEIIRTFGSLRPRESGVALRLPPQSKSATVSRFQ